MNEIQVFSNPEFSSVRAMLIDGKPWFIGRDVAAALGYGGDNPASKSLSAAIRRHIDPEDKQLLSYQEFQGHRFDDPGNFKVAETTTLDDINHYGAYIINESGVYALIFGSKLPQAKAFKHWVTSEVLPALRSQGSYTMPEVKPPIDPKDYLRAADILSRCRENRLAMVAGVLSQGGFDIDLPQKRTSNTQNTVEVEELTQNQKHLRELLLNHTIYEAAELTGLAPGVISRYRSGKSNPRPERCAILIGALEN